MVTVVRVWLERDRAAVRGRCRGEPAEAAIGGNTGVDIAAMVAAGDSFRQIRNALPAGLGAPDAKLRAGLSEPGGEAKLACVAAPAQWRAATADIAERPTWRHRVIQAERGNHHSARAARLSMGRGR